MSSKQKQRRKQWSFKASDGTIIELAQHLPKKEGTAVFINPYRHMDDAVAKHYPEYLDEFKAAKEQRAANIAFLDNLLK